MQVKICPEASSFIEFLEWSSLPQSDDSILNYHRLEFIFNFLEAQLSALNTALACEQDIHTEQRSASFHQSFTEITISQEQIKTFFSRLININSLNSIRQDSIIFMLTLSVHSKILSVPFRDYHSNSPFFISQFFHDSKSVLTFTASYLLINPLTQFCKLPQHHLVKWLRHSEFSHHPRITEIMEEQSESSTELAHLISPTHPSHRLIGTIEAAIDYFVANRVFPPNFNLSELVKNPHDFQSAVYALIESLTPPEGLYARLEAENLKALFFFELAELSIKKEISDWLFYLIKSFNSEIADMSCNFRYESAKEFQAKVYQFSCFGYFFAGCAQDLSCQIAMALEQWCISALDSTSNTVLILSLFSSFFKMINVDAVELFANRLEFVSALFVKIHEKLSLERSTHPSMNLLYLALETFTSQNCSKLSQKIMKHISLPETFKPFTCTSSTLKYISPSLAARLNHAFSTEIKVSKSSPSQPSQQIRMIFPRITNKVQFSESDTLISNEVIMPPMTPDRFSGERNLRRDPQNFLAKMDENDRNDIEALVLVLRERLFRHLKSKLTAKKSCLSILEDSNFVNALKNKIRARLENGIKLMLIDYGTDYETTLVSIYTDSTLNRLLTDLRKYIQNMQKTIK